MTGASRKITFDSLPPPISACFTNVKGRGRVPTKRYKDWTALALKAISDQRVAPMPGEVSITVGLVAPDKRERDGDNLLKALFDTLKKAGVIQGDSNRYLCKHTAEWLSSGPPVTMLIQTYEGSAA